VGRAVSDAGGAFLTPDDLAARVGLSVRSVMRAIAAGELEASQLTRRGGWRIRPEAVDEWIQARSNRPRGRETAAPAVRGRGRRGRLVVTQNMGRSR
jgi:excisionase family DNA binding protein